MSIRTLLVVLAATVFALPATALVQIDFEQPYLVHDGWQVWDFCLIHDGAQYDVFYHAIPEDDPYPWHANHIWRSTSPDLVHWTEPEIVKSVSTNLYEAEALWAPDVVHDPVTGFWIMAYTGVDPFFNQRICTAWSNDLENWGPIFGNPQIQPVPEIFHFDVASGWAMCRDPYLYQADGQWHVLATAQSAAPGFPGVLLHAASPDLFAWGDQDIFITNDGPSPERVLESCTYIVREGVHHLFYHESGLHGVRHIYTTDPEQWTMSVAENIGLGIAPEVDTFDGGQNWVISRLGQFQDHPDSAVIHYVAHFDTLVFEPGQDHPDIEVTHALAREFDSYTGDSVFGNPVLGDNPARRGGPPVGLVGNSYFGSGEFFQGPMGYGIGGGTLGDHADAYLESHPFVIEGNSMSLLIGGDLSEDLYVALMDAESHRILRQAFAEDNATMAEQIWDLRLLHGIEAYVLIVDADTTGHLNVDHIVESFEQPPIAVLPAATDLALRDLGPRPNPFNPRTELRFELTRAGPFRARIHDLRGRLVWDSGARRGQAGLNAVAWSGLGRAGTPAPGGVYVYRIEAGGHTVSGKLTLLP